MLPAYALPDALRQQAVYLPKASHTHCSAVQCHFQWQESACQKDCVHLICVWQYCSLAFSHRSCLLHVTCFLFSPFFLTEIRGTTGNIWTRNMHLKCSCSFIAAVGARLKLDGWVCRGQAVGCGGKAQVACVGVQGAGSRVWLSPPPYFRAGTNRRATFSINLWFKVGNSRGEVFQYLLSQQGKPDGDEWGPSQVLTALAWPSPQACR